MNMDNFTAEELQENFLIRNNFVDPVITGLEQRLFDMTELEYMEYLRGLNSHVLPADML